MAQPAGLQMFLASERCEVHISPDRPLVIRRGAGPGELLLSDPGVTADAEGAAELRIDGEDLILIPRADAGPVLVNGAKITGQTTLCEGDRLRLGYTTLVVQAIRTDGSALTSVRTLSLDTRFLQRRGVLDAEADRLSQWSEGFDRMAAADDEEAAASVILHQLLAFAGGERGLIAFGWPPQSLASSDLSASEEERVLAYLAKLPEETDIQLPSEKELFATDGPGRWLIVRHKTTDEVWSAAALVGAVAANTDLAYRALARLANMVLLHRSLHARRSQARLVAELSESIRAVTRPAEEQNLAIVRSKFVFASRAMQDICRGLTRAAAAPCPVLILGEPGTGKQLAAEALHAASARRHKPLIACSLTEFPEALIESQLFGHARGAFTGAREHRGLVEQADGGTLFLDEIGEAPLSVQAKLLRVLEYGVFWRAGDTRQRKVDLRLISATNRDLAGEVAAGRFRQDLYDRISVIPITLPSLRERPDDIEPLVERFLEQACGAMNKRVSIAPDAIAQLRSLPWPDNVRGLKHLVERIVALSDDRSRVSTRQLDTFLGRAARDEAPPAQFVELSRLETELRDQGRMNQARILRELVGSRERRSKSAWCEALGISRPVFRRDLRGLVAYCLDNDVPLSFFDERLALRPEDWREIESQREGKQAGERV